MVVAYFFGPPCTSHKGQGRGFLTERSPSPDFPSGTLPPHKSILLPANTVLRVVSTPLFSIFRNAWLVRLAVGRGGQ